MERKEKYDELAFLADMAKSRVIFWDRIPEHVEAKKLDGGRRVTVEKGDYPMVQVLEVTLEGNAGLEKYVPICRYQVERYKHDGSEVQRMIFYSLSIDGYQKSAEYKVDGHWSSATSGSTAGIKIGGIPSAVSNYADWYVGIEALPKQIEFWTIRDLFLKQLVQGEFERVRVVSGQYDWKQ